jgi:hypothetical protein
MFLAAPGDGNVVGLDVAFRNSGGVCGVAPILAVEGGELIAEYCRYRRVGSALVRIRPSVNADHS